MVVLIRGVSGSGKREAVKSILRQCKTAVEVHSDMAPMGCDVFAWMHERIQSLVSEGRQVVVVGQFKHYAQVLAVRRLLPEGVNFIVVNCSPRHADMQKWVGEVALRS